MANLPPRTVVAQAECAACGAPVDVILNKNGIAYYFHNGVTPDGFMCSHHQKWGRGHSDMMQRAYLDARKAAKPAKKEPSNDEPTAAAGNGIDEPDLRDEPKPDTGKRDIIDELFGG